jgi:hypothetical protein
LESDRRPCPKFAAQRLPAWEEVYQLAELPTISRGHIGCETDFPLAISSAFLITLSLCRGAFTVFEM